MNAKRSILLAAGAAMVILSISTVSGFADSRSKRIFGPNICPWGTDSSGFCKPPPVTSRDVVYLGSAVVIGAFR